LFIIESHTVIQASHRNPTANRIKFDVSIRIGSFRVEPFAIRLPDVLLHPALELLLPLSACSHESAQKLDSVREKQITGLLKELKVPGLSIAIIKNATVDGIFTFGFKSSESKEPVDSSTVFEAGSMSKPVFAYAVMKLYEKGVLDLDTPLT